MTIGEAFASAGHPVPLYSWLVYWPEPGLSNKRWFYLDLNDPARKNLYVFVHDKWQAVEDLNYSEDEARLLDGQIQDSISLEDADMIIAKGVVPGFEWKELPE